MAIRVDVQDGNAGRLTIDGWEFTRVAIVSEVVGVGHARIFAAAQALIAVVGTIGASHPTVVACKLQEIVPSSVSTDSIKFSLVYKQEDDPDQPTSATIEVGTSLSQVETNKDANGEVISLSYTYPADYELDPKKRGKTVTQGGLISRLQPETSLVYKRVESTSPASKSKLYVGKVSLSGWALDPSAEDRTWLCMSITGSSDDNGVKWDVNHVFQHRADTWDQTVLFINPDDGKPPDDLVDDVGKKVIRVYKAINFDGLNL